MQIDTSILIAFILYFGAMLAIGIYFYRKSKTFPTTFWRTAARQLGDGAQRAGVRHVRLASARAACGGVLVRASAAWIAIGLGIGTYLNWKLVAVRLRKFTYVADDSITIPQYASKPFHEQIDCDPQRLRRHHFRILPGLHSFRVQHGRQAVPICIPLRLRHGADNRLDRHHRIHLSRRLPRRMLNRLHPGHADVRGACDCADCSRVQYARSFV